MVLFAAVSAPDAAVFLAVVGARLALPLFIPRFPLPAILACLVLDAADQTIFQRATDLDLTDYQSYDKALDVYYLTIAYLSVVRNWGAATLMPIGMFLWYYRLVGVTLFELTETRALLLIFPNTFEYYFIAIEAIRCGWNPDRMKRRTAILLAAFIWVFIKLPQEYWIHVAQLDTTDLIKEDILGVDPDSSWRDGFANRPWVLVLLVAVLIGVVFAGRTIARRLPPRDWALTARADVVNERMGWVPTADGLLTEERSVWWLVEKVVLVGLVSVIFFMLYPESSATNAQVFLVVALAVVALSAAQLGREWVAARRRAVAPWAITWLTNLLIAVLALWFFANLVAEEFGLVTVRDVGFFAVLITIIVTMYDRYRRHRAACASSTSILAARTGFEPVPPP